jgi:hypothetical protein
MKRVLSAWGMWAMVLAVAGCGGKGPDSGLGQGGGDPAANGRGVAVPELDAQVPPGLAGKVSFEAVTGVDGRAVVRPRGWEPGAIPGRLKPPAGGDLGFATVFATGASCDGACEPKDWAAVVERVELAQFRGGGWTLVKDDALPDGRLVVARRGEDRVDIALARWKPGGTRYGYCRVTLDAPLVGAAPAFEAACRRMASPVD